MVKATYEAFDCSAPQLENARIRLARTIRLDISDTSTYLLPAEPGEWAVTGTFAFANSDLNLLTNKGQIAFRYG